MQDHFYIGRFSDEKDIVTRPVPCNSRTSSLCLVDAQSDFYKFVDSIVKPAPQGFFKYPGYLFHAPLPRLNQSAQSMFNQSNRSRCQDTAIFFQELRLIKNYSDHPELFKDFAFEADPTKPSYIGRDGEILSFYIQGTDAGYYMIYDFVSELMYFDFVSLDAADQVASRLFEQCVDGYFINDAHTLEQELVRSLEYYDMLKSEFGY